MVLCSLQDGQAFLGTRDLKRSNPKRYKHILPTNGNWHSHVHNGMKDVTLWWHALLQCMCNKTGKYDYDNKGRVIYTKIFPRMNKIEDDAQKHVQQLFHSVTSAVWAFLIHRVREPPVALLFRNPRMYFSLIRNAGAIVLLQFTRWVGTEMRCDSTISRIK